MAALIEPTISPCTQARYDEMLGALPPLEFTSKGFLCGEAETHARCTVTRRWLPVYDAFFVRGGGCFEAAEPLSIYEFRALQERAE